MNKKSIIGLVGLVLVLAFVVYLVNGNGTTESNSSINPVTSYNGTYKTVDDACKLLSPDNAKQVIGSSAKAETAVSQTADSEEVIVAACTYKTTDESLPTQTASLILRSPKNQAGATSNQAPFNTAKPANSQTVNDVGESAYWNPELGQLNVLYEGNWLIITAGPVKASDRTQEQAIQAAKLILPKI